MILNLSNLIQFVEYHHFQMEVAMKLVDQHCLMASIDVRDAYYRVPIHVDHQK